MYLTKLIYKMQSGLISLLPMVVECLQGTDIPIIAAGGIADAHGYVAALALGARGVCLGTRYGLSFESISTLGFRVQGLELCNAFNSKP